MREGKSKTSSDKWKKGQALELEEEAAVADGTDLLLDALPRPRSLPQKALEARLASPAVKQHDVERKEVRSALVEAGLVLEALRDLVKASKKVRNTLAEDC